MNWKQRALTRRAAVVVAGLAALAGAGGVAYATIPDSGGVIHACYAKSGGAVRVIDSSVTSCKAGETSLSWNVTGAQGPPGLQGPPGQQGPPGPVGISGYEIVSGEFDEFQPGEFFDAVANCPAGKTVLGGGGGAGGADTNIINSGPSGLTLDGRATSWEVAGFGGSIHEGAQAVAICANLGP